MCVKVLRIASQGNIHKVFFVFKAPESCQDWMWVAVPSEFESVRFLAAAVVVIYRWRCCGWRRRLLGRRRCRSPSWGWSLRICTRGVACGRALVTGRFRSTHYFEVRRLHVLQVPWKTESNKNYFEKWKTNTTTQIGQLLLLLQIVSSLNQRKKTNTLKLLGSFTISLSLSSLTFKPIMVQL